MFPIGRIEDKSVVTTSFRPGALLITRNGLSVRKRRNTRSTPNILLLLFRIKVIMISLLDIITINMSILFQPLRKYVFSPINNPFENIFRNISET